MPAPSAAFYRQCASQAARGTAARANALWWLIGAAILWAILLISRLKMEAPTSVVGVVGFTLVSGIVSVALAWSVIFVWRFLFVIPFQRWNSERATAERALHALAAIRTQQQPILTIDFEYASNFVEKIRDGSAILIRVLVSVSAPANGCRARLRGISRLEADRWVTTKYDESLDMHWATKGYTPIDLYPHDRQFLDVVVIDGNNALHPWLEIEPVRQRDNFTNDGTYRFNILVTADGCPQSVCSLKIELTDHWDAPLITRLPDSEFLHD